MKIAIEANALVVASGALGFVTALTLSMPPALADPMQAEPVIPVAPGPVPAAAPAVPAPVVAPSPEPEAAVAPAPAMAPPPALPVLPLAVAPPDPAPPAPTPAPAPDGAVQPNSLPTPADGVPHLSSPQNLPPDTTDVPPDAGQPRGLGYLRDIWHAYQTQEVSGRDALLLLTQRPLDADAVPPPGMPANPTPPLPPGPPLPEPAPTP